jgi:hypothetical protein
MPGPTEVRQNGRYKVKTSSEQMACGFDTRRHFLETGRGFLFFCGVCF